MDLERELAGLLAEHADRVCVPVHTMVAEATLRGRRLKRQRRLRIAGTAAVVAGLLAGGAATGLTRTGAVAPAANGPASGASGPAAAAPDGDSKLAREMADTLRGALPPGGSLRVHHDATTTDRQVWVELLYDDGLGRADVQVFLDARQPGERSADCTPDTAEESDAAGVIGCADVPGAHGTVSTARSYQGGSGICTLVYTLRSEQGARVTVSVSNGAPGEGTGPSRSRREPPLDAAAWQHAVQAAGWQELAERAGLGR